MRLWLRTLCVHYFLCAEGENYSQEGKSGVSSCQSSIHISHAEPRLEFHPPLLLLCTVAQRSIGMNCVTLRFPERTCTGEKLQGTNSKKERGNKIFRFLPPSPSKSCQPYGPEFSGDWQIRRDLRSLPTWEKHQIDIKRKKPLFSLVSFSSFSQLLEKVFWQRLVVRKRNEKRERERARSRLKILMNVTILPKNWKALFFLSPLLPSKKVWWIAPAPQFHRKKGVEKKGRIFESSPFLDYLSFGKRERAREGKTLNIRSAPFFLPHLLGFSFFFSRDFPFPFSLYGKIQYSHIWRRLAETEGSRLPFPRDSPIFLKPRWLFWGRKTESCFCCVALLKIHIFKYWQFPPSFLESCCLLPSPSDKGDRYRKGQETNFKRGFPEKKKKKKKYPSSKSFVWRMDSEILLLCPGKRGMRRILNFEKPLLFPCKMPGIYYRKESLFFLGKRELNIPFSPPLAKWHLRRRERRRRILSCNKEGCELESWQQILPLAKQANKPCTVLREKEQ